MKVSEWMDLFRKNTKKRIFSLNDLIVLTGEDRKKISVQLSRLSRSGLIENPFKGWYTNPFNSPDGEELAMVIRSPSYLSMEYALSKSGILSQDVHTYTLITTKLPYTYGNEVDTYEYHQVKRSLFWGFRQEGNVRMADPEKALLDMIYIRYSRSRRSRESSILSLMDDMYLEELDSERLIDYSTRFDSASRQFVITHFDTG